MTTPTRTRCRFNPHIQWFHPPINLVWSRMEDGTTPDEDDLATGIMPELWAMEVALTLDRIWNTDVGRSVMECVRKRTTIYPTDDGGQAYPDPYPDNPLAMTAGRGREEIAALAQTTGTRALIQFNPSTRVHRADGSTTRSPDATLLHELAHAVSITWGAYNARGFTPIERARRSATSPEEEFAWVIDNMHRSERGMWLRQRYVGGGFAAPGARSVTNHHFAMEAVSWCNWRLRPLAARLESIDQRTCPYNPFREYARMSPSARP